jgi:antirestriction protein
MTATPRVYVGTYAKYNGGSIKGAWLDLDDYDDRDAFYEAAKALHADEPDPELMFQDFEGFPRSLYSESNVSEALIDFAQLDEDDRELLALYLEHVNDDADIDKAREAFCGTYDNRAAWAEEMLEESGALDEVPESLRNYIDFDAYARDADHDGMVFVREGGELWVFRND